MAYNCCGYTDQHYHSSEDGSPVFTGREERRAEAVGQFNLGHAHGHRAAISGEVAYPESDHPAYQSGWATGVSGQVHPGPGAVGY